MIEDRYLSDGEAAKFLLVGKLRGIMIDCSTCKYYLEFDDCTSLFDINPKVLHHPKFYAPICENWS